MRSWRLPLALLMLPLGGCIVHTTRRVPPPPCRDAVWVEGHHSHHGWRPGHWACPAPRAVVVVPR